MLSFSAETPPPPLGVSSLLYAIPPASRNGPKAPGGGGGALERGWVDGWMERKHSGGHIPRTQAMKPKLRAMTLIASPSWAKPQLASDG